jgi:hypothetical protein
MLKHSEGKLCNYSKFKTNFGLEKYLCILKSFEQRRNFTRFRISSHRLQIERGRYQGALRQDRLCLRCTSGEIDDEKHVLISCSKTLDNSFSPLIFVISNVIEPYQEGILISTNFFDSLYASFNKVKLESKFSNLYQ